MLLLQGEEVRLNRVDGSECRDTWMRLLDLGSKQGGIGIRRICDQMSLAKPVSDLVRCWSRARGMWSVEAVGIYRDNREVVNVDTRDQS